jgi:hypothetical protein
MKRILIGIVVFCWFGAAGYGQTSELHELRSLMAKAASLEKSLGPVSSKNSPDIGRLREEFEQAVQRIDFLKTGVIRSIEQGLEKKDLSPIDGYIQFVQAIPRDDPARTQFLPLSSAIRSKLVFQSVMHKAHLPEMQDRIEFLAQNTGDITVRRTQPTTRSSRKNQVPIYIAFHWHMHQPIYWPYEDILTTERRNVYSFSIADVHYSRMGPYSSWPFNAVKTMADAQLPHGGAQVSFSGSLIENLNTLAKANGGLQNWHQAYAGGRRLKTAKGNPRLDLVSFGYHHPLMALIGYEDIKRQILAHKDILLKTFGTDVPYSKGIFPPENAFAEWMIPGLVDSGLEWVMVDNIHFNRACKGYPWVKGENLYPPNPADQVNVNPGAWVQLNGLWAPSKVSAWADRPHFVEYIDPETGKTAVTPDGKKAKMIAVPTERYLGNEDGRGGFGALNYEMVMSQLLEHNTDPKHPILLVLHHDGDNYGGGTDSYYHENFRRFVDWVKANPDRFVTTTVQDYLDLFPPAADDVIHVEPGSWAGADNGDPEFLKWNGDPDPKTGYSPDRNSWGVMTACRNLVATARDLGVPKDALAEAERQLMVAQTSCYEYWDGTEMWDSHPTRACNQAVAAILPHLGAKLPDKTAPAIYMPQRQPYNPGGQEWGQTPEPSDFTVWTYVYDFNGLENVVLKARVHEGKTAVDAACRAYKGGTWRDIPMQGKDIAAQTNPKPTHKALEYAAVVGGVKHALVDYYIWAKDKAGNTAVSPLMHVYVGSGEISGGGTGQADLVVAPAKPRAGDRITFTSRRPGKLHWGINGWKLPHSAYWPKDTVIWPDNKAVETPMVKGADGIFTTVIGPLNDPAKPVAQVDAVMHYEDTSWGQDKIVPIE